MLSKRHSLHNDVGGLEIGADGIEKFDWHRRHDLFNLLTLPFICGVNLLYLTTNALYISDMLLWLQFYLFALYLILDTVWVVVRPQSVSSPSTIISHHIVCLIGWIVPQMSDVYLSRWTSLGLVVEINTFFLIARRYFHRPLFLQIMFYTTWILFRVIMFPIVLYYFSFKYVEYSVSSHHGDGNYFNTGLFVLVTMIFLNILNFKWSWDLFFKPQGLRRKDSHSRGL